METRRRKLRRPSSLAMHWLDRKWHKVVEKKLIEFENEPFGKIIVHGGNDFSYDEDPI